MIKNSDMHECRILKLQRGRKVMKFMADTWARGGVVYITTYTKCTKYTSKHSSMFKMGKSGSVYVQSGKNWNCIDFCKITAA